MLIVQSTRLDAFFNLGLEDYLLDEVERRGRILFIYRNKDAVVIGKNQNPWRECDVPGIRSDGVTLARRSSGGGAVYHDEGNLNFSIMLPRVEYDLDAQFMTVLAALEGLGISAERSGLNGLTAGGRKFSGNAFCLRRNVALHHGTLLVKSDLGRLNRYLKPAITGVETKAIASVPAQVLNLSEIVPTLTINVARVALIDQFVDIYGDNGRISDQQIDPTAIAPYEAKMRTWEWIFGHTPRFEVKLPGRRRVAVEHGKIVGTGKKFDVTSG
ncbi:MAG TPA: lipoate--protein ligase [Kiritimatiellia bacterium]